MLEVICISRLRGVATADGSGRGSFLKFEDIGAGSGMEQGAISWTCSDQ